MVRETLKSLPALKLIIANNLVIKVSIIIYINYLNL